VLLAAYLIGRRERSKIGVCEVSESAIDDLPGVKSAGGPGTVRQDDLSTRRRVAFRARQVFNIALTVILVIVLLFQLLPLEVAFVVAFALAVAVSWLRNKGASRVAIVSHSLGATMANHYLIYTSAPAVDAWVMISIINGLEDMFRIKVPVLDVFGSNDWSVTRFGGDERLAQIRKIAGSKQVVVTGAEHFFEGHREELTRSIVSFLDAALPAK